MSESKRAYCPHCTYPLNACVCHALSPMTSITEVIVMQHPSEVNHAKNTVKLLTLALPQTQVFVGEKTEDFAELISYLASQSKPIYLVYPCETSQSAKQANILPDCIIILLDGTWRKAYKLLQSNPWLHNFPALHLDAKNLSNYRIRKAKRADSLSTLEACAYLLQELDHPLDISPIFAAFDAMVQYKLNSMPDNVRARYNKDGT